MLHILYYLVNFPWSASFLLFIFKINFFPFAHENYGYFLIHQWFSWQKAMAVRLLHIFVGIWYQTVLSFDSEMVSIRVERKEKKKVSLFSGGELQPVWHNLLTRLGSRNVFMRSRDRHTQSVFFFSFISLLTTFVVFSCFLSLFDFDVDGLFHSKRIQSDFA